MIPGGDAVKRVGVVFSDNGSSVDCSFYRPDRRELYGIDGESKGLCLQVEPRFHSEDHLWHSLDPMPCPGAILMSSETFNSPKLTTSSSKSVS